MPTINHSNSRLNADEALRKLQDGNIRFTRGELTFPLAQNQILASLARGQHPYATILGCSDSRIPPEVIFDVGLGDLFVIRVAGNIYSLEIAGSLQYAGSHLHTPLFVVLGHSGCGAVQAALETQLFGKQHLSRIQVLIKDILPGLPEPDTKLSRSAQLERAVEANVLWTVRQLRETIEVKMRIVEGQMKLVGAVCEMELGLVRFLL